MRALASTLPDVTGKQKAPPQDGALSRTDVAVLHLLLAHLSLFRLVVAWREADSADFEVAVDDGRCADGRRAKFDTTTAEIGFGRCSAK